MSRIPNWPFFSWLSLFWESREIVGTNTLGVMLCCRQVSTQVKTTENNLRLTRVIPTGHPPDEGAGGGGWAHLQHGWGWGGWERHTQVPAPPPAWLLVLGSDKGDWGMGGWGADLRRMGRQKGVWPNSPNRYRWNRWQGLLAVFFRIFDLSLGCSRVFLGCFQGAFKGCF